MHAHFAPQPDDPLAIVPDKVEVRSLLRTVNNVSALDQCKLMMKKKLIEVHGGSPERGSAMVSQLPGCEKTVGNIRIIRVSSNLSNEIQENKPKSQQPTK